MMSQLVVPKLTRPASILAVVCGAAFTINLATTAVNIALPTLSRELTASTQQLLSVLAMAAPVYTVIEAPTRSWARMSMLGGFAARGLLRR
ncbi:MAG: hypothetical protein JWP83_6162 [Mycobacterium sp.]|jgi:hypothetical protein|nr:hypothetical protein [Mycobacterium sp.]